MHVGLALIFSWTLALLVSNRWLRGALFAYPLLMSYVVVASGNHFWLDAVFGAATSALAAGVAILLAKIRPEWSFRADPPPGQVTAQAKAEPEAAAA
jgi:membrane-associated phospholipid phosphatase